MKGGAQEGMPSFNWDLHAVDLLFSEHPSWQVGNSHRPYPREIHGLNMFKPLIGFL